TTPRRERCSRARWAWALPTRCRVSLGRAPTRWPRRERRGRSERPCDDESSCTSGGLVAWMQRCPRRDDSSIPSMPGAAADRLTRDPDPVAEREAPDVPGRERNPTSQADPDRIGAGADEALGHAESYPPALDAPHFPDARD